MTTNQDTASSNEPTQFSNLAMAKASVIAPLRHLKPIPPDLLRTACVEGGKIFGKDEVSEQSIRNWLKALRKGGVEELERKVREGESELDACLVEHIEDLILSPRKYSRSKIRREAEKYAREKLHIEQAPTFDQVRYIDENMEEDLWTYGREGLAAYRAEHELVRRFEAEYPNHIWQSDHHILDIIVVDPVTGKELGRPWITKIQDDHSRGICGYHLSMRHPNSMSITLAVRDAMLRKTGRRQNWPCGIPKLLYVDNGKDFRSEHLEQVCTHFNIELKHHERYLPRSKGKIERYFRTLEQMCIAYLDGYVGSNPADRPERVVPQMTLEQVRVEIERFITDEYHERQHGTTKMKPRVRWSDTIFYLRTVEDNEEYYLDHLLKRTTRQVHNDGIHFNNNWYMDKEFLIEKYIGKELVLFHNTHDYSSIRLWYRDGEREIPICTAVPQVALAQLGISQTLTQHNKERLKVFQARVNAGKKRLGESNQQKLTANNTTPSASPALEKDTSSNGSSSSTRTPQSDQQQPNEAKARQDELLRLRYQRRQNN